MKNILPAAFKLFVISLLFLTFMTNTDAQIKPFKVLAVASPDQTPVFKALVLAERGGDHEAFVVSALDWLNRFAKEKNFEFTVVNYAAEIDEALLSKFKDMVGNAIIWAAGK
jgi:hypothetical protein